ncbi:MAG: hypothetical protein NZM42_12770 [Gemmatales bacterium]|nr:hypothetical protein [Gemmatales bacterium]
MSDSDIVEQLRQPRNDIPDAWLSGRRSLDLAKDWGIRSLAKTLLFLGLAQRFSYRAGFVLFWTGNDTLIFQRTEVIITILGLFERFSSGSDTLSMDSPKMNWAARSAGPFHID